MTATTQPNIKFWNRTAPGYAKKPVANEEAYRLWLERVATHLEPHHSALEIGCGTGTTALKLSPFASRIWATDCSDAMISIARQRAQAEGATNVTFSQATLDDARFTPESFDVVLGFNLFHLLPSVPSAANRARELLKPGGLFISKTPCIGEVNVLLRAALPVLKAIGVAPYVNVFTRQTLLDDITGAGFRVLESGQFPETSHNLLVVAQKT